MTISTGNFPKALRPGVFAWTMMEYKQHAALWPMLFKDEKSDQAYEELVSGYTFGNMPVKGEGGTVSYTTESQGAVTRASQVVYALGFITTWEEARDNKYEKLGKRRGSRLAAAARRTQETVGANVFNRAFSNSYTFGDGKELLATDHPSLNGDQQNELTTAADLSEAALEDLCILIRKATDGVGNKINLTPKKLAYAPENAFEACRILESEKQSNSAENNINALKSKGMIPEHFDNPYFTDADAWFVLTDVPASDGLICFENFPFTMMHDSDSDTLNEKSFGLQRYVFTCGDWHAVYGSAGA